MSNFRYLALAGAVALAGAGCNAVADDDSSAVYMTAAFEGESGSEGAVGFLVDVVDDTGTTADDFFEVRVESIPKTDREISDFYVIHFTAYQVSFTRPDGRNTPGVDVPFPMTLALGGTLPVGGETQLNLLFVTQEMKLQAPLRNLWFGENQRIFGTLHVRIFGEDRLGNEVAADASAPIVFGDI